MGFEVDGLFLSLDYSILIDEKLAKKLFIDLEKWITPYGYYSQLNNSIICNDTIKDGCYIILGKVSYPGKKRMSYHEVYQFGLIKNRGLDLIMHRPLNKYPNLPQNIPLNPMFPMFYIGKLEEFSSAIEVIKSLEGKYLTIDQLKVNINKYPIETVEGKIYRLRLALERYINKEF